MQEHLSTKVKKSKNQTSLKNPRIAPIEANQKTWKSNNAVPMSCYSNTRNLPRNSINIFVCRLDRRRPQWALKELRQTRSAILAPGAKLLWMNRNRRFSEKFFGHNTRNQLGQLVGMYLLGFLGSTATNHQRKRGFYAILSAFADTWFVCQTAFVSDRSNGIWMELLGNSSRIIMHGKCSFFSLQ